MRKWQAFGRRAEKYGPATIREAQIAVSEVLSRLHFNTAVFCDWYEALATGCHLQKRWKTDLVAREFRTRKVWRKLPYFSGQISFRPSLSFSSVFPSNAFQNIHKHVMIFLTQQPFVLRFVFSYKSRDFAYLCDDWMQCSIHWANQGNWRAGHCEFVIYSMVKMTLIEFVWNDWFFLENTRKII